MTIKDKVAIITGASSGIGFATALTLSKAGAKIAAGARRVDKLQQLENEIKNIGGDILVQRLDVTKKSNCYDIVDQTIKKWGTVDILVNNAGIMPISLIEKRKVNEWEQMIDVNFRGVLYCTAAVLPYLKEKKSGHIVNVSSTASKLVFPSGSVYCATKRAVTAFSEGLRQELGPSLNIRVTCIMPGTTETALLNSITDESLKKMVGESIKKIQSLKPQDIANVILFAVQSPEHMAMNEITVMRTGLKHIT
jgi:NADP-dependent 3-hydroxy acid dehydrogenase YdfG